MVYNSTTKAMYGVIIKHAVFIFVTHTAIHMVNTSLEKLVVVQLHNSASCLQPINLDTNSNIIDHKSIDGVLKGNTMTTFARALRKESRKTHTENGATAYSTTGSAVLDLFGCIGSLRERNQSEIERLFADAYRQDPLLTTRCVFYARDIRGGLGERNTFRVILRYAAKHHQEAVKPNIPLIGLYGRYDDLYCLVGTPLEADMWEYMDAQFKLDEFNMKRGKPCSLLAKWIKTPDGSAKQTRKLGCMTALHLDRSVYMFKRRLRALRKYLHIVEAQMSANKWNEIDYSIVPSRAAMIYRKAFLRHDEARYQAYIGKVEKGEEKIHADTLYPYDLVHQAWRNRREDATVEAQWRALPNYLTEPANAIVIADTSGSMTCNGGRPLDSSVGLAIYFAERNTGPFHNLWMSFSGDSRIQHLRGETLHQKVENIDYSHWANNTNLERAFMHVLQIAQENNVRQEDMVKSLIVISDMEIDRTAGSWSFYDEMRNRFQQAGYEIPNVVYWNVNSRNDIFHADKNRKGVQLCSGQSPATFKQLMASIGMTPMQMMRRVLNGERYQPVTIG